MKFIFKLLVLLILFVTTTSGKPQEIFHVSKKHYKLYSKEKIYKKCQYFYHDFDKDGKDETINLDKDQIGFQVIGIHGDYAYNLHYNIYDIEDGDYWNEDEDLFDNTYFQITHYDLDSDGKDELIISISNGFDFHSVIYRVGKSNTLAFIYIGTIWGQEMHGMYIDDDNHIYCPFGSQGLSYEYIYQNGRLKEISHDL